MLLDRPLSCSALGVMAVQRGCHGCKKGLSWLYKRFDTLKQTEKADTIILWSNDGKVGIVFVHEQKIWCKRSE